MQQALSALVVCYWTEIPCHAHVLQVHAARVNTAGTSYISLVALINLTTQTKTTCVW